MKQPENRVVPPESRKAVVGYKLDLLKHMATVSVAAIVALASLGAGEGVYSRIFAAGAMSSLILCCVLSAQAAIGYINDYEQPGYVAKEKEGQAGRTEYERADNLAAWSFLLFGAGLVAILFSYLLSQPGMAG